MHFTKKVCDGMLISLLLYVRVYILVFIAYCMLLGNHLKVRILSLILFNTTVTQYYFYCCSMEQQSEPMTILTDRGTDTYAMDIGHIERKAPFAKTGMKSMVS